MLTEGRKWNCILDIVNYLVGQPDYCFGTKSLYSTIGVWSGVGSWKLLDCKQRVRSTPKRRKEVIGVQRRWMEKVRLVICHEQIIENTRHRCQKHSSQFGVEVPVSLTCALRRAILSCSSRTLSVWSMELARSPSVSISWFCKSRGGRFFQLIDLDIYI